ncbi:glycoside hydrolase family 2 protein [Pseudocercospora fijiensis CIRAD86]|uniref:Glycoside hydrolase family 2 protein n=1 Tax=Pseudocercospora fijiensis (strain CIRAD86) TaxID=383855 RepID=M3AY01_PSEFD|nr:glycoside hydrolase family 2 protein [Pseudocercospora fijiensis CIRAD86]EME82028.1 glycoside hydrolase family 2 protein [Pseudocercospora fijiensis CIRAD86]
MNYFLNLAFWGLAGANIAPGAQPLVDGSGISAAIPGWALQSTAQVSEALSDSSRPGFDSSSWHKIGSKGTIMGGLVQAGLYNTTDLFFSDDLESKVSPKPYTVPWLYRNEFTLRPDTGKHFFLQTNGITSKADIWLNGKQIADKVVQAGAYGGKTYDVTKLVNTSNALVIKTYPADYNKDFALGFVDWNPYPPDNGTGVWREVYIKQTGPVALQPPRILTDFNKPGVKSVKITIKTDLQNLESKQVSGTLTGVITSPGKDSIQLSQPFSLASGDAKTVILTTSLQSPQIWWPKQWGEQPLYKAQVTAHVNNAISDRSENRMFGIRHVSSHVNEHNDTIFEVNGMPFQVLGGGYAPDIFLRWDLERFTTQARYVLDMGMNTIRLEGKMEQPELYDVADRMGLMIMAGWECCDKWEAWSYNDDVAGVAVPWNSNDYQTANTSMRHEAAMLQSHPSMLAYLVGSDYWPNDKAAAIYVKALKDWGWQNPIIASAAKRGYPEVLGPSGLKMDGPYDWWYNDQLGAAFGFGSELGAGVGTPEKGSLQKFLSKADMDDLWQHPNKGLYHMSTSDSQFHNRSIYNTALWSRYGAPKNLDDYLLKAQMMDYEATKSQFEGYAAYWENERPATGAIYWMLNNAWPSLHWNQFDYYLHPAGSYFGTKVGSRTEHIAYDYTKKEIYLINRSQNPTGDRTVQSELIDPAGKTISKTAFRIQTTPNTSKSIGKVSGIEKIQDVAFLRLTLEDSGSKSLSRNVYWLTSGLDELDWDASTWYYTPVNKYVDYSALWKMPTASLVTYANAVNGSGTSENAYTVTLRNRSRFPAFFIRLTLVDDAGREIGPVFWEDNYVTLFPEEVLEVRVRFEGGGKGEKVEVSGGNVAGTVIELG